MHSLWTKKCFTASARRFRHHFHKIGFDCLKVRQNKVRGEAEWNRVYEGRFINEMRGIEYGA